MEIAWKLAAFDDLPARELYQVLRLRQEVFVVEQNCVYIDCDGRDQPSLHLLGMADGKLAAYARLIPPGVCYEEASIGRIITASFCRGTGVGMRLMEEALARLESRYGRVPVKIAAQSYLLAFYRRFGFRPLDEFIEDGIPHTHMIRVPEQDVTG